jgi:protein TonB
MAVLLTACGTSSDSPKLTSPTGETPVQEAKAAATGKEPDAEPPRESNARTLDGYKRDAARRIYFRSTPKLYDGAPPPLLKSIVVLSLEIDAQGAIKQLKMIRSNGFRDLEQRAMQSVRDAAPLPIPREGLLKRGRLEYYETWLFRDDDRFQIRSLAEPQAGVPD